jgi:Zn-dependent metalloprotease
MHGCPNPLHCILPPYVLDHMMESPDSEVRTLGVEAIARSASMRAVRSTLSLAPMLMAIPSLDGKKHRLIYDLESRGTTWLPGKLVRSEGGARSKDTAVNEAYDHAGSTYDFFSKVFGRNSLDDHGMTLVSSVHVGARFNNAFWNGEQMAYGDGDQQVFIRFSKSLDVVAHELSHGVVSFTSNLEYRDEPGALNEHFADVFGVLVKQWKKKQDVKAASWLIGAEIMGPKTRAKALRTFKNERAYEKDPLLGTDPQPKHLKNRYKGTADSGGVHFNSGIPNHAFYRVAQALGGKAWEKAGQIWYKSLLALTRESGFKERVATTTMNAGALYGSGSLEQKAVVQAWKDVGF